MMVVIPVRNEQLDDFKRYCRRYGKEHDPSYLGNEELRKLQPDEKHPTYMLLNEHGVVLGATFLMIWQDDRGNRGRFGLLHSRETTLEAYQMLVDAVLPHTEGLDYLYLFIPEGKDEVAEILERLDFRIERYSWVLVRPLDLPVMEPAFPEGYSLRPLEFGKDEETWSMIMNTCFASLSGSGYNSPERVKKVPELETYLEGGLLILWKGDEPVGLVRASLDEDDRRDGYIDHLAVLPAYQGQSLGKNLLRMGIKFCQGHGLRRVWLSVNAENQKAADLYLREGFGKDHVAICYRRELV